MSRKLGWLVLVGIALIATNNVIQFVQNMKSGDPIAYGVFLVVGILTLRDSAIGGAFR
jgi:hypothetical protein